jgi:hypothetical protein
MTPAVPCDLTPTERHELHEKGWCCGAWNARRAKHCIARAGSGTAHLGIGQCKFHFGNAPVEVRKAEIEIARQACERLGLSIVGDPGDFLLSQVWEAAGNVEYYRSLAAQLPSHPDPDIVEMGDDGERRYVRGDPGVYGRTYHVSGIPTGEAKRHILVQMYDDERDRLTKYIAEALKAGVEERRVRLAETSARDLLAAVGRALTAAAVSPEQGEAFRRALISDLRGAQPAAAAG